MSNARDYILAIDNDDHAAQTSAQTTAHELQSRQTTLIDVVKSLGDYINDENEKIRSKAVSYLNAVLLALPSTFLSRQQIQVLTTFLCDRIEDGGALEGLSQLQSLEKFTKDMAQMVVRALFEHFSDLQSRNQLGRYKILHLLNQLMEQHRKALKDMGDESLIGITDMVTGEKDPRNLMIIFSMLRAIMVEWDTTKYAETLFDSVYAYFPITFRPPPNDPYGITAQDLKNRLKDCISSTPMLSPYAIPNMLDKLDSTSPVVKTDVLSCLQACAQAYDSQTMSKYSITLWDALKFEILSPQEPELAEQALLVLREIAVCLSIADTISEPTSPLSQYLRPVTKECLEHFQEPAQRQAKAAGDIVKSISSANHHSTLLIIKSIISPTLTIYQSADTIIKRRALLEIWNKIFESTIITFGTWKSPVIGSKSVDIPLAPFKETFLEIYSQAMMSMIKDEVSFRVTAARGLLLLSELRNLLDEREMGFIIQQLNEIALQDQIDERDDLKRMALENLAEISKFRPQLIMDITFPFFMARLPENQLTDPTSYQDILEGLAQISVESQVSETLIRRLLNRIDALLQEYSSSIDYFKAILSTIFFVMDRIIKMESNGSGLERHFDKVAVGLTQKVVKALQSTSKSILEDYVVLDLLGRIDNIIIKHSPTEKQSYACQNIYLLFDHVELDSIFSSTEIDEFAPNRNAESVTQSSNIQRAMILSAWILAALPRDMPSKIFGIEFVRNVTRKILSFITNAETSYLGDVHRKSNLIDPAVQQACLNQLSLYVNKHLLDEESWKLSTTLFLECISKIDSVHSNSLIQTTFAIARALILRLAPNTNSILEDLLSILKSKNPSTSRTAASSFGTILANDDVLNKSNHASIRLLAPHRVFQVLTPLIGERYKEATDATEKENYLRALSGVLSTVSSDIVLPGLSSLLPLLLQSLDLSDQTVKAATLETFAVVITTSSNILKESGHIQSLVKRLLATASQTKGHFLFNSPKVRQLAVHCLFLMPSKMSSGSSPHPLLSVKKEVLRRLTTILDDPKRDVRKVAVDARAAWIRGIDDVHEED